MHYEFVQLYAAKFDFLAQQDCFYLAIKKTFRGPFKKNFFVRTIV